MLILFVLLFVTTHQAAGHLQCPQVSSSFRGKVDLSSFSVLLEQPEDVGDGGNVSMSDEDPREDQCKLANCKFNRSLLCCSYSVNIMTPYSIQANIASFVGLFSETVKSKIIPM